VGYNDLMFTPEAQVRQSRDSPSKTPSNTHNNLPLPTSFPLSLSPSLHQPPMSSLAPLAPTYQPGDASAQLASREAALQAVEEAARREGNVFTDAQIDEYKEQDRYLPVSRGSASGLRLGLGWGSCVAVVGVSVTRGVRWEFAVRGVDVFGGRNGVQGMQSVLRRRGTRRSSQMLRGTRTSRCSSEWYKATSRGPRNLLGDAYRRTREPSRYAACNSAIGEGRSAGDGVQCAGRRQRDDGLGTAGRGHRVWRRSLCDAERHIHLGKTGWSGAVHVRSWACCRGWFGRYYIAKECHSTGLVRHGDARKTFAREETVIGAQGSPAPGEDSGDGRATKDAGKSVKRRRTTMTGSTSPCERNAAPLRNDGRILEMSGMWRRGAARGTAHTNPGYGWPEGRSSRAARDQVKNDRSPGKGRERRGQAGDRICRKTPGG
jgi:hypothetical protein